MALQVGSYLGHYHVTALIGEGGMGQVYQATDTKLNRQVALKILPEVFASDPDRLARFQREAQVLASLNHSGIAAIYGLEEQDDSRALVLELVEGPTLADRISKGPIPVDGALTIAKQIAEALEAAHEAGVIHRDLKPTNIKLRPDGTVKVLDFGLAKALDTAPEGDPSQSPTLTAAATQMGVIMGTAAYMSPEQARGKPVDRRADIWAFGVVLYEMLTGSKPFPGDDVSQTLARVIDRDPDWGRLPETVPSVLRVYLRRCLEKDPRQRVRDVGDVGLAVSGAFEPTDQGTSAVDAPPQGSGWRQALPWVTGLLVGSLVTGFAARNAIRPVPVRSAVTTFIESPGENRRFTIANNLPDIAMSRDGRRIAYLTGGTPQGAAQLHIRSLDELAARTVVRDGSMLSPFFSDDGTAVGFYEGVGQPVLKQVHLQSGAISVICELPTRAADPVFRGASWGGDDTIVFAWGGGLWRVSARGGTPEPLTEPNLEQLVFHRFPEILPGSETVLFTIAGSDVIDDSRVAALSLDTLESRIVVPNGTSPQYAASGHLLYVFDRDLWAVRFNADRLKAEGESVLVLEDVLTKQSGSSSYAVSHSGSLAYLTEFRRGLANSLMWVDRTGAASIIDTIPPAAYGTPRLSPDGERVLVVVDGDVRVYDLASGRQYPLTSDGTVLFYAGWTPAGDAVTYSSSRGADGGTINVWTQASDGSGTARQLTTLDGQVHFDSWAPDGQTLAAHHHIGTANNQLMVTRDREPETWLGREFNDNNAVFSPDGRYVALVSDQTGGREIYIRPFPGPGGPQPVSVGGGEEPAWARTGELFYRRPSDYAMMVVEVSTDPTLSIGPPRELFKGRYYPGGSPRARYSVTADGQMFVMRGDSVVSADTSANGASGPQLIVVENWGQQLLERLPIE